MSAHLHVVILYIIAMQIINLQSTTRMDQNIFRSSLHFFNHKSFKSHLYIILRRLRDVFVPSFVPLFVCYPRFSSLWPAFMLTVHINAFYNECVLLVNYCQISAGV